MRLKYGCTGIRPTNPTPRNGVSAGGGDVREVFFCFSIAMVEMMDEENASSLGNCHVPHAARCSQELSPVISSLFLLYYCAVGCCQPGCHIKHGSIYKQVSTVTAFCITICYKGRIVTAKSRLRSICRLSASSFSPQNKPKRRFMFNKCSGH